MSTACAVFCINVFFYRNELGWDENHKACPERQGKGLSQLDIRAWSHHVTAQSTALSFSPYSELQLFTETEESALREAVWIGANPPPIAMILGSENQGQSNSVSAFA